MFLAGWLPPPPPQTCWNPLTFTVWAKKDTQCPVFSLKSWPLDLRVVSGGSEHAPAEAEDRKWPFVEERWQYKQSVTSKDKMNSSDLIRKHLLQLLVTIRPWVTANNGTECVIQRRHKPTSYFSTAHYNQSQTSLMSLWVHGPIRGVQMSHRWLSVLLNAL